MGFLKDSVRSMLNLKKQAESIKVGDIELGKCPICESYVSHIYFMQDSTTKKQSKWYSCQCGVVWQSEKPKAIYDKAYSDKYDQLDSKLSDSYRYPVRAYSPIIEELTYQRRALLIGRVLGHQEGELKKRGWVAQSIDRNTSYEPSHNLFVGNFEDYEFDDGIKYGLIWMEHVLECFIDPLSALSKCKSLLTEDGILYIASPDTDFINTRSSVCFKHWKPETNYLMWNRRAIMKALESLGFNIIMSRQNCWQRFPETDDFHIIAQKKFF